MLSRIGACHIERITIGKYVLITVSGRQREQERAALGKALIRDLYLGLGYPSLCDDRWREPQSFFDRVRNERGLLDQLFPLFGMGHEGMEKITSSACSVGQQKIGIDPQASLFLDLA